MSVDVRETETASPFAAIDAAIEDIRSGKFVVVVDDADRENEGDLTIAAQFVTPDAVNFMATHGRGTDLPLPDGRTLRRARAAPDDRAQRDAAPHRVHGLDRGARGCLHRHLRCRPCAHDPGRHRRGLGPARPRPARPCLPTPREARRRPPAHGADRSRRRPRAARRPEPRRRRLRDHERRRDDGACARPRRLLRTARPEDDHGRGSDRVPAPHREARRARRLGPPADRAGRVPGGRLPRAARRGSVISRS